VQATLSPWFEVTPSPSWRTIFWSEAMEQSSIVRYKE
jgi:hypothetical protein